MKPTQKRKGLAIWFAFAALSRAKRPLAWVVTRPRTRLSSHEPRRAGKTKVRPRKARIGLPWSELKKPSRISSNQGQNGDFHRAHVNAEAKPTSLSSPEPSRRHRPRIAQGSRHARHVDVQRSCGVVGKNTIYDEVGIVAKATRIENHLDRRIPLEDIGD